MQDGQVNNRKITSLVVKTLKSLSDLVRPLTQNKNGDLEQVDRMVTYKNVIVKELSHSLRPKNRIRTSNYIYTHVLSERKIQRNERCGCF